MNEIKIGTLSGRKSPSIAWEKRISNRIFFYKYLAVLDNHGKKIRKKIHIFICTVSCGLFLHRCAPGNGRIFSTKIRFCVVVVVVVVAHSTKTKEVATWYILLNLSFRLVMHRGKKGEKNQNCSCYYGCIMYTYSKFANHVS